MAKPVKVFVNFVTEKQLREFEERSRISGPNSATIQPTSRLMRVLHLAPPTQTVDQMLSMIRLQYSKVDPHAQRISNIRESHFCLVPGMYQVGDVFQPDSEVYAVVGGLKRPNPSVGPQSAPQSPKDTPKTRDKRELKRAKRALNEPQFNLYGPSRLSLTNEPVETSAKTPDATPLQAPVTPASSAPPTAAETQPSKEPLKLKKNGEPRKKPGPKGARNAKSESPQPVSAESTVKAEIPVEPETGKKKRGRRKAVKLDGEKPEALEKVNGEPESNESAQKTSELPGSPVKSPGEITPAKATSARATPAKATSAKVIPAKATPAKATPAKAILARAAQTNTAPSEATPAKATPGVSATETPIKPKAAKAGSAKAALAKASPIKNVSVDTPQTEVSPSSNAMELPDVSAVPAQREAVSATAQTESTSPPNKTTAPKSKVAAAIGAIKSSADSAIHNVPVKSIANASKKTEVSHSSTNHSPLDNFADAGVPEENIEESSSNQVTTDALKTEKPLGEMENSDESDSSSESDGPQPRRLAVATPRSKTLTKPKVKATVVPASQPMVVSPREDSPPQLPSSQPVPGLTSLSQLDSLSMPEVHERTKPQLKSHVQPRKPVDEEDEESESSGSDSSNSSSDSDDSAPRRQSNGRLLRGLLHR